MIQNNYNKRYHIVVSVDNKELYNNDHTGVSFIGNMQGILTFLMAGYVFYYNGRIPIKPARSQVVVNMWHGIPLKRIGRLTAPNKDIDYSSYYLAPTKRVGEILCGCFGCGFEKILLNGAPRNDRLFNPVLPKGFIDTINGYDKIISWLPTFRSSDVSSIVDSELSTRSATGLPIIYDLEKLSKLDSFLAKRNTLILIKLHPNEKNTTLYGSHFRNIRVLTDSDITNYKTDLYSILSISHALITDYSSVFFDFLLLDRPICFAVDDIKSYGESRGFTIQDPLSVMPGVKAKSYEDILSFIDGLDKNPDEYSEERKTIAREFCEDTASHSAKSLLERLNIYP